MKGVLANQHIIPGRKPTRQIDDIGAIPYPQLTSPTNVARVANPQALSMTWTNDQDIPCPDEHREIGHPPDALYAD
jgi:hypothetical protein